MQIISCDVIRASTRQCGVRGEGIEQTSEVVHRVTAAASANADTAEEDVRRGEYIY